MASQKSHPINEQKFSQITDFQIALPDGNIEAVTETYVGLSLRGTTKLVEQLARPLSVDVQRPLNRLSEDCFGQQGGLDRRPQQPWQFS